MGWVIVSGAMTAPIDLAALHAGQPLLWVNPGRQERSAAVDRTVAEAIAGVAEAQARFDRFAPRLAELFDELRPAGGTIRSPLLDGAALASTVGLRAGRDRLLVKADHDLAVAGSIKARGGIHAVLEIAERMGGDVPGQAPRGRRIVVGSTGNLGLSVGIIARALGFDVTVHMSAEARAWKKARLREHGAEVVEHDGDYERALVVARETAAADPEATFIDDEHSRPLLHGYGVAAAELAEQLRDRGIVVDAEHPLVVFLPCGVGGAPAGIAVGLHALFGDAVHPFFAEPVQAPSALLALLEAGDGRPSVYDAGLTLRTIADGLAVPRASRLAVTVARGVAAGAFTVSDEELLADLAAAWQTAGMRIEPSAAAGFRGVRRLHETATGRRFLTDSGIAAHPERTTYVVWTTGGRLVPEEEHRAWLSQASHNQKDDLR